MKAAVEQARAQGAQRLEAMERAAFCARYADLLASGLAANPPPQRRPGQRGRLKQSPARNLLERLWMEQDAVLLFLLSQRGKGRGWHMRMERSASCDRWGTDILKQQPTARKTHKTVALTLTSISAVPRACI